MSGAMNMSWVRIAIALLVATWLIGCSASPPENIPTPIEGYNHTSAAINWFTVNKGGGPNLGPHLGGGSQNDVVFLPTRWRPDFKVVVEWEKDPDPFAYSQWPEPLFSDAWRKRMDASKAEYTRHRVILNMPPYDHVGVFDVHFLPCDQVKVIASSFGYGHPQYPFNEPLNMDEPTTCLPQ